jgi:hypothetical protein
LLLMPLALRRGVAGIGAGSNETPG